MSGLKAATLYLVVVMSIFCIAKAIHFQLMLDEYEISGIRRAAHEFFEQYQEEVHKQKNESNNTQV